MATSKTFTSKTGTSYVVEKVLRETDSPIGSVYVARVGSKPVVIKTVDAYNFEFLREIYQNMPDSPYLRSLQDTIPADSALVFDYLTGHLLDFAQIPQPISVTKRVLEDALKALALLHGRGIVHTDIKPDNILIDWSIESTGLNVKRVQLADLEDSALVPNDCDIVGKVVGNWMWRSPEAHAGGRVNKPSDMFSFGLVCIYAVTKRVIFAVDEDELEEGVDKLSIVIGRQISYFADMDGLVGLMNHLQDNPWVQVFEVLRDGFNEDNPRKPFSLWGGIDPGLRDLVTGLTHLDPAKRITAEEALRHSWFRGDGHI